MALMPKRMQIFAFGSNGSGQLGVGHKTDISGPEKCRARTEYLTLDPQKLVGGARFTIILDRDGSLYLAGENPAPEIEKTITLNNITLPHLNTRQAHIGGLNKELEDHLHDATFRQLKLSAAFVSASFESFTIVNKEGNVMTFGQGFKGELGRGDGTKIYAPAADQGVHYLEMPDNLRNRKIIDLASGVQHTVCLYEGGVLVGWGNGRHGELGLERKVFWTPQIVAVIQYNVYRVLCGKDFTWTLGAPGSGRQSFLADSRSNIVTESPDFVPLYRDVFVNWNGAHIWTMDNQMISWGKDSHGQLAGTLLQGVHKLAAGSEHLIAALGPNRIHAWGWGEHGNCGAKVEAGSMIARLGDNIFDASALLGIPIEHRPGVSVRMGVGAGCGTSFIWASSPMSR